MNIGSAQNNGALTTSTVEGVLERIVFFNEENSYTVARLQVPEQRDLVTIVGNMALPNLGETLRLTGEWTNDPKFGRQFRISSCLSVLPSTLTGIQKYLASGLVRGIGPVMAKRIVGRFGIETFDLIEQKPEQLLEIEGIGPIRQERICTAWGEQKEVRQVMVFLQGHGVSSTYAVKIFKAYGNKAIAIVSENPYRLALDITGIGFKTADRIAQNMGIDPGSQIRAEAGILYVLSELVNEGHVYFPYDELTQKSTLLLGVDMAVLKQAISAMVVQGRVAVEEEWEDRPVYLMLLHVAEVNVAKRLGALIESPAGDLQIDAEKAIKWVQQASGIELADLQQEAIRKATSSRALIITGGPGTGKTTLVNSLIKILERKGQRILLASPTGRAAKRLSEVTGKEAKTIHRLLEYTPKKGAFTRNEDNPLQADFVVVDEASMLDILLMNHLLKAIPPEARLILVGDVDQLPSVGPGNVLKDIINSGSIETVRLTEVFRQAQESLIVVNAHRVNEGQFITNKSDGKKDFYFIDREDPNKVLETIKETCSLRLPRAFDFNPMEDIQVLTPMHRGTVGVSNLNAELQAMLNPSGVELTYGGRIFRMGDRVMQTSNNYEKEVFNGDVGRIASVDPEEHTLQVSFDDRVVGYDRTDLDELVLAYAISVHKSQGSEYPAVVIPMLTQHYIMLQRNLLYTALSRARKLVVLIGSRTAVALAIKNDRVQRRYTRLSDRLQGR
ncbi:MAG: ATP-dependent RecD-like DNA helicase [Dehalococcoidia bacterium]|nr:ATP-dependent RecD-like DNA helicase [Dehalococcoidia bacterium]